MHKHRVLFTFSHCCCYEMKWATPTNSTQLPLQLQVPKATGEATWRGFEPGAGGHLDSLGDCAWQAHQGGRGGVVHYRKPRLCREPDPLGTRLIALGTACAERELSAERSRHRWAGKGGSAESQGPNSRHSCAESPLSSRHSAIHSWRRELRALHLCRESRDKLSAQNKDLSTAFGLLSAQAGRRVAPDGGGPHSCAESRWLSSRHRADKRTRGWLLCRELGQEGSRHRAYLGRQSAPLCRELMPLLSAQRPLCREPGLWLSAHIPFFFNKLMVTLITYTSSQAVNIHHRQFIFITGR
jgi:hypothetical protein